MKKTIHVEIADVDFVLNTEAYELLKDYLDELGILFASLDEKDEIIADIEGRVAESLTAISKKEKVVTHEHIHDVLSKIGSPDEIFEVLGEFDLDQKPVSKPRLHRDPDHAIIAGVCSGIAAYFGTDPVIVRLFFIAFALLGGSGILVYVVLWIIIPKAETTAQKKQMYGTKNVLNRIDRGIGQIAKKLRLTEMTQGLEDRVSPKKKTSTKKKPSTKKKASATKKKD